jgi:hypothetical protein
MNRFHAEVHSGCGPRANISDLPRETKVSSVALTIGVDHNQRCQPLLVVSFDLGPFNISGRDQTFRFSRQDGGRDRQAERRYGDDRTRRRAKGNPRRLIPTKWPRGPALSSVADTVNICGIRFPIKFSPSDARHHNPSRLTPLNVAQVIRRRSCASQGTQCPRVGLQGTVCGYHARTVAQGSLGDLFQTCVVRKILKNRNRHAGYAVTQRSARYAMGDVRHARAVDGRTTW